MEYYDLISCSPSVYPDITCRAWDGRHPLEGEIVFIKGLLDGQPANPQFTYELVYLGANACVGANWLPTLSPSTFNTCSPANLAGWEYMNCETGEKRIFAFNTVDPTNKVIRIDGSCECWELIAESNGAEELVGDYSEFDTCFDCLKNRDIVACPTAERTLSFATSVQLPSPPPPDRGFDECCFKQIVFADKNDSDSYKNDFNGFYFKRPTANSDVIFTLLNVGTGLDYVLDNDTYGAFKDFDTVIQPELSFVVVDWRKVLLALGTGAYRVIQEVTVAGQSYTYTSNTFHLQNFSIAAADKTVRVEAEQNAYFSKFDVDFKDTGFKSSLRITGFFGRKEWEYTQTKLVRGNYQSENPNTRIDHVYQFQGNQLPSCIAEYLMNFLVVGTVVKISDYNKNNPSYELIEHEVDLIENSGTDYNSITRKATFNLSFSDRDKNNRILNC